MRKPGKNEEPIAGRFTAYHGDDEMLALDLGMTQGKLPNGEPFWFFDGVVTGENPIARKIIDVNQRLVEDGYESPLTKKSIDKTVADAMSINVWQRYASPVWMDINPSDTLQRQSARDSEDDRHICPLQLGVIRRALQLWSNPGDVVLDPFNGIGSTGHVCMEHGRKYVGIELKKSYYEVATRNLAAVANQPVQQSLF
jgi:DNA modification methylase